MKFLKFRLLIGLAIFPFVSINGMKFAEKHFNTFIGGENFSPDEIDALRAFYNKQIREENESGKNYNPQAAYKAAISALFPGNDNSAPINNEDPINPVTAENNYTKLKIGLATAGGALAVTAGTIAYHNNMAVKEEVDKFCGFLKSEVKSAANGISSSVKKNLVSPVSKKWDKWKKEKFTCKHFAISALSLGSLFAAHKTCQYFDGYDKAMQGLKYLTSKEFRELSSKYKMPVVVTTCSLGAGFGIWALYNHLTTIEQPYMGAYRDFVQSLTEEDYKKIDDTLGDMRPLFRHGDNNPVILQKKTEFFKLLTSDQKLKLDKAVKLFKQYQKQITDERENPSFMTRLSTHLFADQLNF